MVDILSRGLYKEILKLTIEGRLVGSYGLETEAMVNINYMTITKNVKPVATQLPQESKDHIMKAKKEPKLNVTRRIGHNFTKKTLIKLKIEGGEFLKEPQKKKFQEMISKYHKIFVSLLDEIGCINSKIIILMVIFIILPMS